MTAFTAAELQSLGYRVVDGRAVRIADASGIGETAAPKSGKAMGTALVPPPSAPKYRSKTEAHYAARLSSMRVIGLILNYQYEPVRLRIGTDAWYTPDFRVEDRDGTVFLHEVKGGFIREAARVRLHAAAQQYPEYRFVLCQYSKGSWTLTAISR